MEGNGINWYEVIKILGIITLTLLAAAVTTGFLMPKNRKMFFKWHRIFGIAALILGLVHGLIVFLVFGS